MITENLSTLKIHKLSQAQYDRELEAGNIDASALYLTPERGKVRIVKTVNDTTALLEANKYYVFPTMETLTILLAEITDTTFVSEFHFSFQSGATATVLTLPEGILLPADFAIEANSVYEVIILDGRLSYLGWAVS